MSLNQCDGCRRGLPLRDGTHYNPDGSYDHIGCTRHLYERPPVSLSDPCPAPFRQGHHEEYLAGQQVGVAFKDKPSVYCRACGARGRLNDPRVQQRKCERCRTGTTCSSHCEHDIFDGDCPECRVPKDLVEHCSCDQRGRNISCERCA